MAEKTARLYLLARPHGGIPEAGGRTCQVNRPGEDCLFTGWGDRLLQQAEVDHQPAEILPVGVGLDWVAPAHAAPLQQQRGQSQLMGGVTRKTVPIL